MTTWAYGDYPDLSGVKRALVVVLKNIGDVLLSTPVFPAMKEALPGVEVDAMVNSGTEEMLADNPDIGRIIVLDRKALKRGLVSRAREELRVLREVRSGRYDMVLTLSPGQRGQRVALFSGARIRVGPAPKKPGKFLGRPYLTIPVSMAPARRHYVERNLDCLRRIGIFPKPEEKRMAFYEGEAEGFRVEKLLAGAGLSPGERYVAVHPTSRWMFKCWPPAKTAELVNRVGREPGVTVVLTSGPGGAEKKYIDDLKTGLDGGVKVVDLTGVLTLRELGAVIRRARLFFGVDSAPMHMAAAVGTPAAALFGPTSEWDWAPWGPDGPAHKVITSPSHACRPCGRDGCGGSKVSDCLTEIGVDTVFEAVKEMLDDAG